MPEHKVRNYAGIFLFPAKTLAAADSGGFIDAADFAGAGLLGFAEAHLPIAVPVLLEGPGKNPERNTVPRQLVVDVHVNVHVVDSLIGGDECVGLRGPVAQASVDVLSHKETAGLPEVHSSDIGSDLAVESGQGVALCLDVDDTSLSLSVILGGRVLHQLELVD